MPLKILGIIVFGTLFLYGLFTVGAPFLLALIIAILLEPVVQVMVKRLRLSRTFAAAGASSLFVIGLLGAFYLVGLKVFSELIVFLGKLPALLSGVDLYVTKALAGTGGLYETLPAEWAEHIQNGVVMGVGAITDGLKNIIASVSSIFFNFAKTLPGLFIFALVFMIALYLFSFGLDRLKQSFIHLFASESRPKIDQVLSQLRDAIVGFIKAQFIISALTYVVSLIGLLILGVDFPLAIALLIITVDLLPILGTGSVLVPWGIYTIAVGGDVKTGVGLIILFVIITVFRRIVEPKILGDAVGISPLAALISLYVGFSLVGVVGLFLGPVVVIVYQAMKKAGLIHFQIKL